MTDDDIRFRDRSDAGRALAALLGNHGPWPDALVLALPRGGVPIGDEVARVLDLPLDVLIVRKLGVPGQPEFAMGAIASGGLRVTNTEVLRSLGIDESQFIGPEHDAARYCPGLTFEEFSGWYPTALKITSRGRFDLLVTGASAVSMEGVRFGKGHGFFDLEWGMFTDVGIVDEATPVVAWMSVQPTSERRTVLQLSASPAKALPVASPEARNVATPRLATKVLKLDIDCSPIVVAPQRGRCAILLRLSASVFSQTPFWCSFKKRNCTSGGAGWPNSDTPLPFWWMARTCLSPPPSACA